MPKEIWNEGRVVGLSAYEIYVKQHVASGSELPVASEREWLSASLAMGNSLLLKCPSSAGSPGPQDHNFVDIAFPSRSRLAAANTIVAQFFDGEGYLDSGDWAIRVSSFGSGISNESGENKHPSGEVLNINTDTVPTGTAADMDDHTKACLQNYMKIVDGIVINPGNWVESQEGDPYSDFHPNYASNQAVLRLHIRGNIDSENRPWILLTGFTIKNVLAGVSGGDGSVDNLTEEESADGEFLGPSIFPWAAKVCFVVPSSYIAYLSNGLYTRGLANPAPSGGTYDPDDYVYSSVNDTPIIDMRTVNPQDFYGTGSTSGNLASYSQDTRNPKVPDDVTAFSVTGDAGAVLTVYSKRTTYPPALYGSLISDEGQKYLFPLDVVAPGTVKIFHGQPADRLAMYQDYYPGTTAINKTPDGKLQLLDDNGNLVSAADITLGNIDYTGIGGGNTAKYVQISVGGSSAKVLSLQSAINGNQYTISANPTNTISLNSSNSSDNISWSALLSALANDKALDLLGTRLKSAKQSLVRTHGSVANQGPFLEFGPESKKLRLYISDVPPSTSDVPVGSIGIGWGLES